MRAAHREEILRANMRVVDDVAPRVPVAVQVLIHHLPIDLTLVEASAVRSEAEQQLVAAWLDHFASGMG